MYLIKRTDQGGGYVATPGRANSYTNRIENAQIFLSRSVADSQRCKGNEVIVELESLINVYEYRL